MKKLNKLFIIMILIFGINNVKADVYSTVSCGSSSNIPSALPTFIHNIIDIIKIAVPVILIILGMIDFSKAVVSNDEKQMKDTQNKFVKRIIGAIAIFLIVSLTQFIFKLIGENSTNAMASCIDCFINNVCKTTDPYLICLRDRKTKCEDNCYYAVGSHTSSEFYTCVNSCIYKNPCD